MSDRKYQTLCPNCEAGWGVPVDEDGFCSTCGVCASGDGVDTVAAEIHRLRDTLDKKCVECFEANGEIARLRAENEKMPLMAEVVREAQALSDHLKEGVGAVINLKPLRAALDNLARAGGERK